MKKIIFRVDASPEIGAGHFMRCIALSQSFVDIGIKPVFLTQTTNQFLLDKAIDDGIKIIRIEMDSNLAKDAFYVNEVARETGAEWIILDGYDFITTEYQSNVKKSGKKVLCIDDLAEEFFTCDAVINQNIGAEMFNYSCEPQTKLFLGTKYLLIKREFKKLTNRKRTIPEQAKNILVTLGGEGSYVSEGIEKIINAINLLPYSDLHAKVLIGSKFNDINYTNTLKRHTKIKIDLLPFVSDMYKLMDWADVVVTAAGSTIWELMLTHSPMLVFTIVDNQKYVEKHLKEYECSKIMGWIQSSNIEEIAIKAGEIIGSKKLRSQYSSKCEEIVRCNFNFFNPNLIDI